MQRYLIGFDGVQASNAFKSRLVEQTAEYSRMPQREEQAYRPVGMTHKRRALIAVMAAVLVLLSACAAYAVYWSSTQRAKEYSQSEQAVNDRLAYAEQSADAIIAGTTYYSAIDGTGEADGISFELKGVSYWANDDPPELNVAFNATDAKTGDDSRLTDFEYVLSVGGEDYPAYGKADGTARELPAVARADTEALGAQYEIWFRIEDQMIVSDMPMTLTCTLYAYDENGLRGDVLGSFSLDFVYDIATEQIEADRARLITEILGQLDAEAEENNAALEQLPDEMTELNITQDEYTFNDAQTTEDGFILGQTRVTYGADTAEFYMDGYHCYGETISHIFTPDTARPRQDAAWEAEYFGTTESVTRYPWYAPVDELPETVLIAVLRDAGTSTRQKADINGYKEGSVTYTWDAVELLLRVNPRTGEITLPKDDAEREAWREETLRLAEDGRNEKSYCPLDGSQTVGDVSLTLERLGFDPAQRYLYIRYTIDGLYCPPESHSSAQHIYLDGTELEGWYDGSQYSASAAKLWVESFGTFDKVTGWDSSTSGNSMPTVPEYLPDTFEIRFVWDVYDRDEEYNRVFIGTFDITTTIHKADIVPGELFDY